ncbi:M48 family metallopeptidase [Neorhodopirellula pilleata]|uniref:TPR repeat-containing protein YfgC n=1 Tax=Neorhodopirellula pilleata TaxID=2714738 RepID=A0A5C6AQW8_9BACT|nr:M48 family metallopeptidase [Neorhodopirellula pilleata]TWU01609.1 TPR repeat-containing protein YfgC precursor [Neorhodopirellula pilleata]
MDEHFSGGCFCETLPDGRCGGDVELRPAGVFARAPDGQEFLIPYRECQVEIGGFSGKMVFCRGRDRNITIFCEDPRFVRSLSLASSGILDEQLQIGLRKQRGENRRQWVIGTGLLVGIVMACVVGYFAIRAGATAAVMALPISVDEKIGSAAMASMDLGGPRVTDDVVVEAMQSMVDRMAPEAAINGLDFRVSVVQSDVVNAFALPGGSMVVYTGLIENAERPEQVAAVLAHEMSHATLRHGLQRVARSMGIWAGVSMLIGDVGGLIGAGADLFQMATINSYSREQETEADREGVRMLHASGIDPTGMGEFFALLQHEHDEVPEIFSWISTHPDHAARIASVENMIAGLPEQNYEPLDVDWPSVQGRLKNLKTD